MEEAATPWSGWDDEESDSKERVREQLSEMSRLREEQNGESNSENSAPPKRRRGRPKKSKDETRSSMSGSTPSGTRKRKSRTRRSSSESTGDYSLDDDLEDEEEEHEEPEDDPDDPEFEPNRRVSRRQRKPVKTYNQKLLFKEEMSKTVEPSRSRRGRPRGSGKKRVDPVMAGWADGVSFDRKRMVAGSDANEYDRLLKEEISLYEQHLPKLPPTIPDPMQRLYVVRVDGVEALQNAGAGFRLMTSCVTDDMMVSLFHVTTDRYFVNSNAEDVLQLAQVLRHVWNMLPLQTRLAWEDAARKLALTSEVAKENGEANEDKENNEENNEAPSRKETMPLRDFPFGAKLPEQQQGNGPCSRPMVHGPHPIDSARKNRTIESSCCSIHSKWATFTDVQSHMIAGHYSAVFYGCHFCGVLYSSVEALLAHSDCTRWAGMLLSQMVKDGGKQIRRVHMKVAYMFLVCSDCGLWLPIRVNYPTDRLPKAWSFFATVMENHSCKKVVPLLIYMAELMEVPSRDARVLIQFVPSFLKNFPYSCEECKIEAFATPDEMDLHFQKVHHIKYKCTKCGECSGTELYHKAHLSTHLSDSLLLADYLRTTCTFHPPPHCRDAPEVVGCDQRSPASGGATTTHTATLLEHDLINHCDELAKLKILNSLENAKIAGASSEEETDEEEEADPCKHRADAAYEEFDYSLLESSQEEKEAKREVNDFFHKINGTSEPEEAVLDWRSRVNDPIKTVTMLNTHAKANIVTLETSLAADKFAELLVAKFAKRISLPISACMELLSGNLFLKRFMFCTICNTIVTTQAGIEAHNKSKCGVEGLLSLYCPPMPVNTEIECPSCSFKLCSISAMRGHMALQHGIYVEYKNIAPTTGCTSESNASLQELASRYPDTRSAVARETDSALWLRYGVLQPKTQFDMQLKLAMKGIRVTGVERKDGQTAGSGAQSTPRSMQRNTVQVRRTALPTMENTMSRPGAEVKDDQRQTSTPNQGLTQHYIKPFVLVNNMLRCKFCAHQTSTPQAMRDHLQSNHVLVCRACGNGFAHREALTRHGKMGRCSMFFKDASVKHISADCGVCKKRMSLANAYLHLFREHLSSVVYGTVSGQVYPEHQNLHIDESLGEGPNAVKDSVIYSPTIDQQHPKERNAREVVVYKRPAHAVCSCYLCGMEMVSLEQLARHLSKHSEKWSRCPFCYDTVPIPNHEAMKAHLMERHMQKRDGSWTCRYCQRLLVRGSYAHLLYMCTQTRKCALCRGEQSVKNAAEMTVHWTNRHLDILRRFQCSDCGMTFCHVEDFWAHQCRSYFMQQKCSCGFDTVFSSRTAFLLHFGMHMDEPNMTCKLCKFRFSSRVALQNHRLSHAILINSSSGRQLVILDTKLVVPEILDDRRVKRVKEIEPISEEKRVSLDVAVTMRHLIRSVCEQLGEPYDSSKSSSPQYEASLLEAAEDDIIEIDSPKVDDDLVEIADATQAVLSAEVRIEAADGVVDAGSGMPGYVEDDEDDAIECITTEKSEAAPVGTAVLKPVSDDTADDDLKVVAEVEYAPGSNAAAAASGREKKFKCSKCSCSFMTTYAMKTHELSAHSTDAGGICDKVFGVPVRGFYFICRNCCAAFESQQQFKVHRLSHGPTGSVSCGECSAIAYNTPLYEHHRQAHATPDRLFYGCSHCNLMFRTDARLMHHLREAHGVSLFFFCKACHLGGTHERTVYAHVAVKSQRCRQFGAQKNWNSLMMLGVCPTSVLHYQPRCVATHEFTLDRNGLEVVIPSECVHRSFLAPTDSLITCRDCFCTMTAASFTAAETFRNGGVAKELAMTLDNSTEFPFLGIYDQAPLEGTSTAPGRAIAPRPTEIQAVSNLALSNMRVCPDPPSLHSRMPVRAPPPAPATQPLPVGTRVAAVAPLMSNKVSALPVKRRPPSNSDVITLSDDEPGPSAAKRAAHSHSPAVQSPLAAKSKPTDNTNRCKICDAAMPSAQIQSLHELHRNGMKWFCLDCASAQMDEVEAMKHYFSTHVKAAEQKTIEKGMMFRPLHYELRCPFPKCREALTTLTNLRMHINNKHRNETAYPSATCMFRFCSPFAKSKHDGQHSTYESVNGVEGTCCPLCGTLNQWNIQMPGTSYTMSHIAVHGLRRYHMCRDCFVCFKGDYDCVRMKAHFETTHCTSIPKTNNRELLCKLCREVILKSHLAEHVIEKHLVTGFKSRDPKNQGKLVVKTGAVTRRFLGFERIYHVGDDSDMD
ncbi:hypothetical protein GCK32_001972 [Trichostrongylus colubriformis]|uniref:C2H2-type domain-containing protein n=2 Tax=Trichostrongylidae TaxID=6315 RepID=A0AAN8FJD9_TRICO